VTDWLRRAGHVRVATGEAITWAVAEGRRGRRWRELVRLGQGGPGLRHSLLLETDPNGRFSHLELSTHSGLFTIHPEADGTLHGNGVVDHGEAGLRDASGVEHVRGLVWPPDGIVLVEGSLVCQLAAIHALEGVIEPSSARSQSTAWIPLTLWLAIRPVRVERMEERRWRFGDAEALEVDLDGLPRLDAGTTWPLEASD
jgi:hypothetical protein